MEPNGSAEGVQVPDSPEAIADILAEPNPSVGFTEEEAKVAAKLLPALTKKVTDQTLAMYGAQYRQQFDDLQKANHEALQKAIDEVRKTAKPLDKEEITSLLSQEYGTFPVQIADGDRTIDFTIKELPVSAEKRLMKEIRTSLGPILKAVSAVEWEAMAGASMAERIERIVGLVPDSLDMLAACTAVCLDPRGKEKITGEWVVDTIGLNRMVGILTAQITASRYRDFFSLASRLYQQSRTTA